MFSRPHWCVLALLPLPERLSWSLLSSSLSSLLSSSAFAPAGTLVIYTSHVGHIVNSSFARWFHRKKVPHLLECQESGWPGNWQYQFWNKCCILYIPYLRHEHYCLAVQKPTLCTQVEPMGLWILMSVAQAEPTEWFSKRAIQVRSKPLLYETDQTLCRGFPIWKHSLVLIPIELWWSLERTGKPFGVSNLFGRAAAEASSFSNSGPDGPGSIYCATFFIVVFFLFLSLYTYKYRYWDCWRPPNLHTVCRGAFALRAGVLNGQEVGGTDCQTACVRPQNRLVQSFYFGCFVWKLFLGSTDMKWRFCNTCRFVRATSLGFSIWNMCSKFL